MTKKSSRRVSETEYKERAQLLNWEGLRKLWVKIRLKSTPGWAPGKALEYLILRAFELELGEAHVRYPFSVYLDTDEVEQIDGVVYLPNFSCLIEAKDYGNEREPDKERPINFEPLAKMRSQLLRRPASAVGSFFTTSSFTAPALTLARYLAPQTILLWEKKHLEFALQREKICDLLQKKYRHCIETGNPDLDVTII